MRRKGQAAMEFLMTYGWALLIVIIVIAALAFFGLLNPGNLLPAKCDLGPGLSCTEFAGYSDSVILFVENGLGTTLDQVSIAIEDCGGDDVVPVGGSTAKFAPGAMMQFEIPCSAVADAKMGSEATVKYNSGTLPHSRNGFISTDIPAAGTNYVNWHEFSVAGFSLGAGSITGTAADPGTIAIVIETSNAIKEDNPSDVDTGATIAIAGCTDTGGAVDNTEQGDIPVDGTVTFAVTCDGALTAGTIVRDVTITYDDFEDAAAPNTDLKTVTGSMVIVVS